MHAVMTYVNQVPVQAENGSEVESRVSGVDASGLDDAGAHAHELDSALVTLNLDSGKDRIHRLTLLSNFWNQVTTLHLARVLNPSFAGFVRASKHGYCFWIE